MNLGHWNGRAGCAAKAVSLHPASIVRQADGDVDLVKRDPGAGKKAAQQQGYRDVIFRGNVSQTRSEDIQQGDAARYAQANDG